ncbi:hypothetical protein P154DRAFT_548815 [Amniculicola lignicola CBS 123094]|uniref:Uncharacterized protein n=1 Tax=Amniculicola lignicola CBS 123094 TaxID=1392246 RepID=A0A6A5VZ89_9PLEO|nr:hypothetical protein P154DRAFT_548815 [Amniculicola lignicola CBS 123094]
MSAVPRADLPDSVESPKKTGSETTLKSFFEKCTKDSSAKSLWKPHALRPSILVVTTATCWALIAILQYLLSKSQRNGGILFASNINALPLSQTFLFRYLSTIIAVTFSIFWTWIDLETKRLEPYYQLSKDGGALGKDSLLLQYPFDFIPFVPIKAIKDRHWPVFWASFAVVLVTWGIVPFQAGIFTTNEISRTFNATYATSTAFLAAADQETKLTLHYAQSTYGIVNLNETLPPYMTRDYALAPFKVLNGDSALDSTWTAPTTLYSLDLKCEASRKEPSSLDHSPTYLSKSGCYWDMGLSGNITAGEIGRGNVKDLLTPKGFTAMYVGFWNLGFASFYLQTACPPEANHTFYAAFTRNKNNPADPPQNVTAMFCEPFYYSQEVKATVDVIHRTPVKVEPLGAKKQISSEMYNTTLFEAQLNSGASNSEVRGALPTRSYPNYLDRLTNTNMSLLNSEYLQRMAALAVLVDKRPLEDFLEFEGLKESYQSAYRLLFVRSMVEVLDQNFSSPAQIMGEREVRSQAVILVPLFTFIVEGLLGLVSLATIALLYFTMRIKRNLRSDPSTIASVMSLVAENQTLLSDFENLDCDSRESLEGVLSQRKFKLVDDDFGTRIIEVTEGLTGGVPQTPLIVRQKDPKHSSTGTVKPKLWEFRPYTIVPFACLHILLATSLIVLFIKGRSKGLPLASKSKFVNNLVENYIPTAIATLIEPIWILINRLLCMLQPIEELRGCSASPQRSIELDYSSLPPQLVIYKALRSGHLVLATVCAMSLLANILAIAFGGLFNQESSIRIPTAMKFDLDVQAKFVSINGSVGPFMTTNLYSGFQPSGAYSGGLAEDIFLIAESHYVRGSPMPTWTDEKMMYIPFIPTDDAAHRSNNTYYEARTKAFGAQLDCEILEAGKSYNAELHATEFGDMSVSFNTSVGAGNSSTKCFSGMEIKPGPANSSTMTTRICQEGRTAAEFIFLPEAHPNASQTENEACKRFVSFAYVRSSSGTCDEPRNGTFDANNSVFVQCTPKVLIGDATVTVDDKGQLHELVRDLQILKSTADGNNESTMEHFSNEPRELIGQFHKYIFRPSSAIIHNDSFAGDYFHHFIRRMHNNSRLLDPNSPLPSLNEINGLVGDAYSMLFSIWLGTYKEKLLLPINSTSSLPRTQAGFAHTAHTRLFLSTPLTIISLSILITYAITSILVYIRRPGRFLPRLPTSIASVIALFASSAAVQDMRGTSQMRKQERREYLEDLDYMYGYGSFVGGDGKVKRGIERAPFDGTFSPLIECDQGIRPVHKLLLCEKICFSMSFFPQS